VIDARGEELSKQVLARTGGRGVEAAIDFVSRRRRSKACIRSLAPAGRLVIVGTAPNPCSARTRPFRVDPGLMLRKMLEIPRLRYVTLAELAQTLELLRQKRLKAIVTVPSRLEQLEEAHQLLRQNAIPGRAAAVLD